MASVTHREEVQQSMEVYFDIFVGKLAVAISIYCFNSGSMDVAPLNLDVIEVSKRLNYDEKAADTYRGRLPYVLAHSYDAIA